MNPPFRKLLVANRSEIAIRVFRAATELGVRTVAIYAEEDALSLHRFKADEAYRVGAPGGPVAAYLAIDAIIGVAVRAGADAIHPGYGFLAESPEFAEACAAAGIVFVGPAPETMRQLGDKVSARRIAVEAGVPVMPATEPLPAGAAAIRSLGADIGYPLMVKASWGGGGRGMRPVHDPDELVAAVETGRREARSAFGRDEVYLEKLVENALHIEVQLLGDTHGTLLHLFERDCTVQRRRQKVVERAPAPFLKAETRDKLTAAALAIGRATDYVGAGTVEFLVDADTGAFHFIEVNPRIQVEHTVTEMVTGIDLVQAQILVAAGGRLGVPEETGVPPQDRIRLNGHALQCRITAEDPANDFIPDYGRITAYRGAFGFGVRVDGGTAYSGAVVTRHYDPLLEKVTAWAPTPDAVIARMLRALREYRIRGVATNLAFLDTLLSSSAFQTGAYTTRFIDETPALLETPKRQDRATKLLTYIADVTVNGHPEVRGLARPAVRATLHAPVIGHAEPRPGARDILRDRGPAGFSRWMRAQSRALVTDTTMRDAHQSLLATRVRTLDIVRAAEPTANALPGLLSLECWGGATFDVALRFLLEDPWERLAALRAAVPRLPLQMLLRGANAVGYANYPDNVVRHFIGRAAAGGIDIFRVFDCLNWVENMRVAIDAVVETGAVAQGAICYTGDILDPDRAKYSLAYYVGLAGRLEAAGCHSLAIKDMAGVLRPAAARALVRALRGATDLPIQLHTHDTSGGAMATLIAAIEEGVDAVDAAMDAMSGGTSQPALGTLVEALRHTPRDTGLDGPSIRAISRYWEQVRGQYAAFEGGLASGESEVYVHEMPGGQVTNLRQQAASLGLAHRWPEVVEAYAAANLLFGDIVKVTPTSKVVGDMALMMVAQGLRARDVLDPSRDIAFPASVAEMLRGDLGQPPGGWPEAIARRVLGDERPSTARPGSLLPSADLAAARDEGARAAGEPLDEDALASWLMYPRLLAGFAEARRRFGPVAALPTSVFFYGMTPGEEIAVDIEPGKTLNIRLHALGEAEEDGRVRVFFELNGQPRTILVDDRARAPRRAAKRQGDPNDPGHVLAPTPGVVTTLAVRVGQSVQAGDMLATLEAMKMETTLSAPQSGIVAELLVKLGEAVEAKALLLVVRDEGREAP